MKKILIFTILYLSVFAVSSDESTWFPKETFYHSRALGEYINSVDLSDQNIVRNEYLTILAFINENIIAHQENIEKLLPGAYCIKAPSLIDGNLSLVEIEVPVTEMWDSGLQEYVLIPDQDTYHDEVIRLSISVRVYNILIDFWYNRTGELLHERINYDVVISNIIDLIKTSKR